MNEENNKYKIDVYSEDGEIVIREGKALPLKEPEVVRIDGTIDAPLRYLKNRYKAAELPAVACMIIVNKEKGSIYLAIAENDPYGDRITGKLQETDAITKFSINNGKYISPDDMSNFLRERKHLFESQAKYSEVFAALRTFKAKVEQQINTIKDDSGNYDLKRKQAVEHNVPKSFKLSLPIFKGMPKVTFEVEILVNSGLDVTLYSGELIQFTDELRDKYISEVVKEIEKVTPDILIMYQ